MSSRKQRRDARVPGVIVRNQPNILLSGQQKILMLPRFRGKRYDLSSPVNFFGEPRR